jgi:hypothetical protein
MRWDEENGWSLSVRGEPLTSEVHKGLDGSTGDLWDLAHIS